MTQWRPVVGYEGRYEVSDDGQVKVLAGPGSGRGNSDRILRVRRDDSGYHHVSLYRGEGRGKFVDRRVHILVLEAFVGPRPPGASGLHTDDDRDNNRLSNLRWGTRSENTRDMVANGNHNNARKTHCKHGHPFSGDNLRVTRRGWRVCLTCLAERHRRARNRAGAVA